MLVTLAVLLLAGGAAGAWWYFNQTPPEPAAPISSEATASEVLADITWLKEAQRVSDQQFVTSSVIDEGSELYEYYLLGTLHSSTIGAGDIYFFLLSCDGRICRGDFEEKIFVKTEKGIYLLANYFAYYSRANVSSIDQAVSDRFALSQVTEVKREVRILTNYTLDGLETPATITINGEAFATSGPLSLLQNHTNAAGVPEKYQEEWQETVIKTDTNPVFIRFYRNFNRIGSVAREEILFLSLPAGIVQQYEPWYHRLDKSDKKIIWNDGSTSDLNQYTSHTGVCHGYSGDDVLNDSVVTSRDIRESGKIDGKSVYSFVSGDHPVVREYEKIIHDAEYRKEPPLDKRLVLHQDGLGRWVVLRSVFYYKPGC